MKSVTENQPHVADGSGNPSSSAESSATTGGEGGVQLKPADVRDLRTAISQGWNIKPEYLKLMPGILANIALTAKSDREKRQAIRTLAMMHKSNVDQAAVLDKMNRLDDGKPTDVVELKPITLRVTEKIG